MAEEDFEWKLGEILVQNGWLTWPQLQKALELQKQTRKVLRRVLLERKMIDRQKEQVLNLGEILVQNGWLDWEKLKTGLELQKRDGRMIGEILVENRLIDRENLYRGLAIQYGKVFVDFSKIQVAQEAIERVPRRLAVDLKIMPLLFKQDMFLVAISDPRDVRAEEELQRQFPDFKIHAALAPPEAIDLAIQKYYPL